MPSSWKEKKKAKKEQARVLEEQAKVREKEEAERERIRLYDRVWRKANLAKVAERQRRWRAKKKAMADTTKNATV